MTGEQKTPESVEMMHAPGAVNKGLPLKKGNLHSCHSKCAGDDGRGQLPEPTVLSLTQYVCLDVSKYQTLSLKNIYKIKCVK